MLDRAGPSHADASRPSVPFHGISTNRSTRMTAANNPEQAFRSQVAEICRARDVGWADIFASQYDELRSEYMPAA
jgi:hypothetical protein